MVDSWSLRTAEGDEGEAKGDDEQGVLKTHNSPVGYKEATFGSVP